MSSLDEACANHLLVVELRGFVSYRFCHLLIKKLVSELIPPAERAQLHAKISLFFEERYSEKSEENAAEVLYHSSLAGGLIEPEKVAQHAYRAGAQAMRLYDCERALAFFEKGLSLIADSSCHALRGRLLQGARSGRNPYC